MMAHRIPRTVAFRTTSLTATLQPYRALRSVPESSTFDTAGRMAELADARDLKSRVPLGTCGFDPRFGH